MVLAEIGNADLTRSLGADVVIDYKQQSFELVLRSLIEGVLERSRS